jgi:hypothetical protein
MGAFDASTSAIDSAFGDFSDALQWRLQQLLLVTRPNGGSVEFRMSLSSSAAPSQSCHRNSSQGMDCLQCVCLHGENNEFTGKWDILDEVYVDWIGVDNFRQITCTGK